jgi:uncharacterized protein YgbK (DUF1537 family)
VHYKVCSTFDSSPTVGSIGRAIEVGAEIFPGSFVPLVVGAPTLGRYCVFGNLFARMGIGSAGAIHRLDRHPAMSHHAVTPMDESDLRRHLAKQTRKRIALFDVLDAERPEAEARVRLDALVRENAAIVLFDVLRDEHLHLIGRLIDRSAHRGRPLFSVGSSAVEMALGAGWRGRAPSAWPPLRPTKPLLVVSGSCSPVTARQIAWADAHGFAIVPLGKNAHAAASAALRAGRHALVCSSRGKRHRTTLPARTLGTELGRLARTLVAEHGVKRLVVAGGDTSSYAARALGIEALEMIAPLAPGAPLCRAYATDPAIDGLEVNFKGGQVGAEDYFGAAARGKL